jgi:hypothetical protein
MERACLKGKGARGPATERGRAALRPRHAHDTRTCARAALLPRHARSSGRRRSAGTPAGTPNSSLPTTPRRACSTLSTAGRALSTARARGARAEDPLGHLPPVRRQAGTPTACQPPVRRQAHARRTRWDTYRLSTDDARARAQRGATHPRARRVEQMRWGARPQCADDARARRAPRAAHAKARTVKYQVRAAHSKVSG